jgi:hypothetical protein
VRGNQRGRIDKAGGGQTEAILQPAQGPSRPGIDRNIEDNEIEAGGQIVGADRIPVAGAVDCCSLGLGQGQHFRFRDRPAAMAGQRGQVMPRLVAPPGSSG